jgi:hypothetical protein
MHILRYSFTSYRTLSDLGQNWVFTLIRRGARLRKG